MTRTIHPVDATAGAPAYGGRMLRQVGSVALAGASAADPFGGHSGVRPGTSTATVTATSTLWTVNPHAGLLDFETAMESGPTPYSIDAAVTGAVRAADAFARVDLIWVRQDIPLEDGAAAPDVVPGYTYGTVASTPPATPARCMVLAWVNVPASGGGSPTVTWKAPFAAAAGAPIPVWSQAERDALVLWDGLSVYRLDLHLIEVYNGTTWTGGPQAFTPVLGPGAVNYTATGRYIQVGKLVTAWFTITLNASFGISAGDMTVSLPVTGNVGVGATSGSARLFQAGNAYLGTRLALASSTTIKFQTTPTYGGTLTNVAFNSPWTWVAGGILDGFVTYEAA